MIRIAICDDETDARDALRIQLEKVLDETKEQIVYEFSSGARTCHWLRNHPGEIDILFLDIEMNGKNGMEIAAAIREFNQNIFIIFVTGYSDYVFDGYKVNAFDYIIKPATETQIQELMIRLKKEIQKQTEKVFVFQNTDGTYRFPLSDISYFYSDKRSIGVVIEEKEYRFYGKLNTIEQQLPNFIRIHQRYFIHPNHVKQIGSNFVLMDDKKQTVLPISRSLKETAIRKLALSMIGGFS